MSNQAIDVDYEIMSVLHRHQIYWLTAEAISWELDVSETDVADCLDRYVECGWVEQLSYSIVWYRITDDGARNFSLYRLAYKS